MPSFQRLTELSYAISRNGGIATVADCKRALRLPDAPTAELLTAAVEAELVAREEGDVFTLLPPGISLAAAMTERLADAQRRSLESFQPYTTYVPERWWP